MEKSSSITRVHLIISGDVQGVGFRAWVLRLAWDLHLVGWVTNREDGAVEIVAEGQKAKLDEFVDLCRKGPDVAWVRQTRLEWLDATGEFMGFQVLY